MNTKDNLPEKFPLVTVGLTCFNAKDTIEQALDSAKNQAWPNIEIIVVDDASSDGSVERIRQMAEGDERIRLIRHEVNQGYPAALNTIIQHAKGEFVAIFDDDDTNVPDRLLRQWRRLTEYEAEQSAELVFCYSNREVVMPGDTEPNHIAYAIGRKPPEPRGQVVADFILWHGEGKEKLTWGMFGSCTLMARLSSFQKIGQFDERFRRSAEWDMAIRAAFQGAHFIAVDQSLIIQHKTFTADKSDDKKIKYSLMLRKKYKEYLKKQHVYLASLAMAYSRFHYALGRPWRSRLYLALACLCSPFLVLPNEFAKRRIYKNALRTEN
jgi:glycosyltransferase involved in cell wall biosynthesis